MFYESKKKNEAKAVTPQLVEETNYRMRWVSRHKFRISGLKIHSQKTQMVTESSSKCSVFFLSTKKAFGYEIVLQGIQQCCLHGEGQDVLF